MRARARVLNTLRGRVPPARTTFLFRQAPGVTNSLPQFRPKPALLPSPGRNRECPEFYRGGCPKRPKGSVNLRYTLIETLISTVSAIRTVSWAIRMKRLSIGYLHGGGRVLEGVSPIGVNLPDGCDEFSLIPSSIRQSASSHLCPEAILFQ